MRQTFTIIAAWAQLLALPPAGGAQALAPLPAVAPLRVAGARFVDPSGRVVLLRGVNLEGNSKVPPFRTGLVPSDLDRLRALGMNVVRLLFLWEAYEPTPGTYDESYLEYIRTLARAAGDRGMYVVIDFHQDGFSRFASRGSGDGFPMWAVSPRGRLSTPDNSIRSKHWPVLMFSDPTTHQSFNEFFSDARGVRTRYLLMVARVARGCATVPAVVGYDMINEPWGDEERELAPLYRDAAASIRAEHPSSILFVEGHITTNCGLQTKLPRPEFDNIAYSPHYYKPSVVVQNSWHGSEVTIDLAFAHMTSKAAEWGVPLFLGEFGVGAENRDAGAYVAALYDRLDANLASGGQWNYTSGWCPVHKDGWNGEDFNILDPSTGAPRPNFRPRPFPRLTAGTPLRFEYRDANPDQPCRTLAYTWEHRPECGDTEIFVPACLFPPGATITVAPDSSCLCFLDESRQTLVCRSHRPGTIVVQVVAPAS